jgi:hypothetical protein
MTPGAKKVVGGLLVLPHGRIVTVFGSLRVGFFSRLVSACFKSSPLLGGILCATERRADEHEERAHHSSAKHALRESPCSVQNGSDHNNAVKCSAAGSMTAMRLQPPFHGVYVSQYRRQCLRL